MYSRPAKPLAPVTAACVERAASVEHVSVAAVAAIMNQEGGRVGQVHHNPDGSVDFGPMQINSRWLPILNHSGITKTELTDNGCVNVLVGAWILRRQIDQTPRHLWTAIGHYHSHTRALSRRYEYQVWRRIRRVSSLSEIIRQANGKQ